MCGSKRDEAIDCGGWSHDRASVEGRASQLLGVLRLGKVNSCWAVRQAVSRWKAYRTLKLKDG